MRHTACCLLNCADIRLRTDSDENDPNKHNNPSNPNNPDRHNNPNNPKNLNNFNKPKDSFQNTPSLSLSLPCLNYHSYFAEGREESIAVTVVDSHGAYYTGSSPVSARAQTTLIRLIAA